MKRRGDGCVKERAVVDRSELRSELEGRRG